VAAVIWAVALLAGACAGPAVSPDREPAPSAQDVLDRLVQRRADMETFAARGRARIVDDRSDYHFDLELAVAPPDRLRFEAFDPVGRPLVSLVARDGTLRVLDHKKARFFEGAAAPANVNRFLPLGLPLEDAVYLLAGLPPVQAPDQAVLRPLSPTDSQRYRLNLIDRSADRAVRLVVRPETAIVESLALGPIVGRPFWRADMTEFDPRGFPGRIAYRSESPQARVDLNYREIQVNFDPPPRLFVLNPPPNITVEPLPGP
jgi:outer membrane lipoprotein-sorting protein